MDRTKLNRTGLDLAGFDRMSSPGKDKSLYIMNPNEGKSCSREWSAQVSKVTEKTEGYASVERRRAAIGVPSSRGD
jgi:hypothetical protein